MGINVFAVARSIWDHELFEDERFTERLAWIWLLSEAAWRPTKTRVGSVVVSLGRGQVSHSVRFMADKWGWHRSKVERFLNRLKTESMIETDAGQGILVITICKYADYQKVGLPEKTVTETPSATEPRQDRDREETGETVKQEDKNPTGRETASVIAMPAKSPEAMVFDRGRAVFGRNAGGFIATMRKECDYDDQLVMQIIEESAAKSEPRAYAAKCLQAVRDRAYRGVIGFVGLNTPNLLTREDRERQRQEDEIYRNVQVLN
jgi:hypothetical protein